MKLYFHGNCQALAMAKMLKEQFPSWDVGSLAVYLPHSDDAFAEHKRQVRAADYVLTHWVAEGYGDREELSTRWVKEQRDAVDRPIMSITQIVCGAEMPSFYYLAKDRTEFKSLGHGYHNVLVPYYICRGWSDQQIVERLMAEDLFTPEFVEFMIGRNLAELRRRDNIYVTRSAWRHLPVADIVERQLAPGRLMHTIDHPQAEVMALLCDEFLEAIGRPERVGPVRTDTLDWLRLPILPSISKVLPGRADSRFTAVGGDQLELPEMIVRAAAEYREHLPGNLQTLLLQRPEIITFLRAFEAQA